MHITAALAWQAAWIFVIAYILGNAGFIVGGMTERKKLSLALWVAAIVLASIAILIWMSTIWINYALNPLP